MSNLTSDLAAGHVMLHVQNLAGSLDFYRAIGLREGDRGDDIAVIELRGGTHILLIERGGEFDNLYANSRFGQRQNETFDLIVRGKTREDLAVYRDQLVADGIEPDEIAPEKLYGHSYFQVTDPDGHIITIYTNHEF